MITWTRRPPHRPGWYLMEAPDDILRVVVSQQYDASLGFLVEVGRNARPAELLALALSAANLPERLP